MLGKNVNEIVVKYTNCDQCLASSVWNPFHVCNIGCEGVKCYGTFLYDDEIIFMMLKRTEPVLTISIKMIQGQKSCSIFPRHRERRNAGVNIDNILNVYGQLLAVLSYFRIK